MQIWKKIKDNPKLLESYFVREKTIDAIRLFFKKQQFHEVQTPILVPTPSCEPNLEVFKTQLKTFKGVKRNAYLIMSPEYSIKKLLAAGVGNCFEITKCFRNEEEVTRLHNPEFTMIEWYRINADYMDIMNDFEKLFLSLVESLKPKQNFSKWVYQNQIYDINPPWLRISVSEAFDKYADIGQDTLLSSESLRKKAEDKGYNIDPKISWEEIFNQILFNEVEPALSKLKKPYFLYDYPTPLASLSRKKAEDPRFSERFEVFLAGIELGNCFSELLDAKEQEARFKKELDERKKAGKSPYPIDEQLIEALKSGLPEVSGIAVGVDRLIMLVGDFSTVSETLFFPAKEIFDLPET